MHFVLCVSVSRWSVICCPVVLFVVYKVLVIDSKYVFASRCLFWLLKAKLYAQKCVALTLGNTFVPKGSIMVAQRYVLVF